MRLCYACSEVSSVAGFLLGCGAAPGLAIRAHATMATGAHLPHNGDPSPMTDPVAHSSSSKTPGDTRAVMMVLMLLFAVTLACKGYFDLTNDRPIPVNRPEPPPAVRVENVVEDGVALRQMMNVPYALAPDVRPAELSLDIFAREDARNAPLLVFLHGGGWGGGDKSGIGPKSRYFARKGFVVASVNYRLGAVTPVHNGAADTAAAIAYLRFVAPTIGANRDRIFLMGHSAGAHFCALVLSDPQYLQAYPGAAEAIKGAILLDGSAYDVPLMMGDLRGLLFAPVFGVGREGWLRVSPVHRIAGNKHVPPMLLVYAANDPLRHASAQAMAKALGKQGTPSRLLSMPELDHGTVDTIIGSDDSEELTRNILDFLADPALAVQ